MRRSCWVALAVVACVRAPAPVRVEGVEARRELQIRIAADRRDVAAYLALARLDEKERPSEAIEALEAVEALGGPLGVRWRDEDRARLARLIAARGRVRVARGTALGDLERARRLGADVAEEEMRQARAARAVVALRHSDAGVRAGGRKELLEVGGVPDNRGQLGAWLWEQGARRAAWDELEAWHRTPQVPRDAALQEAFLVAARWWTPLDRPGPTDLVGPGRCAFDCTAVEALGDERAYLRGPLRRTRDPEEAGAIVLIALHQALRGEGGWGPAIAARVDLSAFADARQLAKVPRHAQPMIARLTGQDVAVPTDAATADQRLLVAAYRVLAGESVAVESPYGEALRRIATPRAPFAGDAFAEAVARHASLVGGSVDDLRAMVVAYRRDPAIADRLGRDAVAGAVDAAVMHAALGALFDALGDPARARASWQAAVDMSPEASFVRGLAEAQARQGDPDAALVNATTAAAASGDPGVVWTSVARLLTDAGSYVQALEASRSAIDLSGPETLAMALETAIAASRALGRDAQAASLGAQRARLFGEQVSIDRDPTDARAALAAQRNAATAARLWIAARWNPRNVELRAALLGSMTADDPRRAVLVGELVDLAAGPDPSIRLAAIAALR